jgi:leader peptidase (prepilin peptidase)/N-methyltransferase
MNPFLITAFALAGLVAGWRLRAIIARYAAPAVPPVSAVPTVSPIPAVPVGERPRYGPSRLTVEVTTALLLGALAARAHPALVLAAACWLALCAVPLAFIDASVRRLPDPLTAAAYAGTAVLLVLAAAAGGDWQDMARAALGGIALTGFYLALALIYPAGLGLGDVKAAAGLGTLLAWAGWPLLIAGGFAGFLLAAFYGIALLVSGRATRKQQIPFGPFMIAGAFLAFLAWPA